MIEFINTIIVISTILLGFELYVKGVTKVLVESYTDDRAEVMGTFTYRMQALILTMCVFSCLVDLLRHIG